MALPTYPIIDGFLISIQISESESFLFLFSDSLAYLALSSKGPYDTMASPSNFSLASSSFFLASLLLILTFFTKIAFVV